MSSAHTFQPSREPGSNQAARILKRIGRYLDQDISHRRDIVRLTQEGLPSASVDAFFKRTRLTRREAAWIIQPRTLAHRKSARQALSVDETGRLFRLANALALAEEVFGDEDKAKSWLDKPLKAFDGHSPLEMLKTEEGAKLVEEAIWKIASGFFA